MQYQIHNHSLFTLLQKEHLVREYKKTGLNGWDGVTGDTKAYGSWRASEARWDKGVPCKGMRQGSMLWYSTPTHPPARFQVSEPHSLYYGICKFDRENFTIIVPKDRRTLNVEKTQVNFVSRPLNSQLELLNEQCYYAVTWKPDTSLLRNTKQRSMNLT